MENFTEGTYIDPNARERHLAKQKTPPIECGRVFCNGTMKMTLDRDHRAQVTCQKCGGHVQKRHRTSTSSLGIDQSPPPYLDDDTKVITLPVSTDAPEPNPAA